MARLLTIAVALAALGCSGRIEPDDRPTFRIDPAEPFRLEFGRGSGWDGLDTIKLDQSGRVVLHRMKQHSRESATVQSWETTTLQLPPAAVTEVLAAVNSNGLMGLHRGYYADAHDGTQWVFWVKQGEREKSVYFDNHFPTSIIRFAEQLDGILTRSGLNVAAWQPVPASESRKHERELWDSLK